MQKMKARAPNGAMVDGTDLEFEEQTAPWTKVKCEDGTIVMVKVQVLGITRMDVFDAVTGIPLYNVNCQPIFRVTNVPADVRKIPNEPPKATNTEVQ
jgi:hypothetical protein